MRDTAGEDRPRRERRCQRVVTYNRCSSPRRPTSDLSPPCLHIPERKHSSTVMHGEGSSRKLACGNIHLTHALQACNARMSHSSRKRRRVVPDAAEVVIKQTTEMVQKVMSKKLLFGSTAGRGGSRICRSPRGGNSKQASPCSSHKGADPSAEPAQRIALGVPRRPAP